MAEIIEVWCRNDASNAVGVVEGESYCATCYPFAVAEAAKAARRLSPGKESEDFLTALYAKAQKGVRP